MPGGEAVAWNLESASEFIRSRSCAMSVEEEKAAPPPVAKSPSQMKLVIVGALALFIALVGAQVAVPLINGVIANSSHASAEGDATDEASVDEEEIVLAEADVDEEEEEPLAPALYTALDPPFVVSFDQEGGARYLQLTLQAMARSEETIAAVKQHSPAIRNSVLFKLSGYELEALNSQAGKEQLRHDLLDAANEILAKNDVEEAIEELYFTSLVVQ
jgi:flagellar FliL protein